MVSLEWSGKKAVVNHHLDVKYRLLCREPSLSVGDADTGNLLIQGDNLNALKALLPYYGGQVKCIYIDPPYNTGNENWVYNDNSKAPEIQRWFGKVVGGEGETLDRHDRWLCMMYPRLQLLHQLLREDGAIFISIDDNEVANLRLVMDDVFGMGNFIATILWQKVYSPKNSAKHFSEDHDYILVYAKNGEKWRPNLVPRSEEQDSAYRNRDNDPRGPWKMSDLSARNFYGAGTYSITCPSGRIIAGPPKGMYWRVSNEKFVEMDRDKRIWWGKDGNAIPQTKRFLGEVKDGVVPQTMWFYKDVGHTQDAKKELLQILSFEDSPSVFVTPKPTKLLQRIIQIGADADSLILDSFAGSGTTGHAVMQLNAQDGGNRRCILVEMEEKIARDITAQRLKRVIEGYGDTKGLGGSFNFCTLSEPVFDAEGQVCKHVRFEDLARHVFFSETGQPLPSVTRKSPLIGEHDGTAYYLLFNGILGEKSADGGNTLTAPLLRTLPAFDGPKLIFGERCMMSQERRKRERITFRQIPYEIKGR